jgi:hypothetical protein
VPPPRGQGGLGEATVVSSPPPTISEVDRLYRQLMEIHAIGATQLAECARWHRSDPTPSPVQARTSRLGTDGMPYATMTAPPLSTSLFSHVSLRQPGAQGEPFACRQGRQVSARPQRCACNPRYDEPREWRRPCHDPKGMLAGMIKSCTHGGPLSQSLHPLIDATKSITEGQCGVTTHHATGTKASLSHPKISNFGM